MVQKNKWLQRFFAVLTMLVFLIGISALTAYASQGADSGSAVSDEGNTPDADNPESADADSDGENEGDSAQDPDSGSSSVVDQGGVDDGAGSNEDNGSDNGDNDSGGTPSVSVPEVIQDQYERIRDYYLNNSEDLPDDISQYSPNENLADLPTTAAQEVAVATAEPLPDVAVSDATLFSGIVMWVCVAVGISVVAGVMVSRRTHRKNV